MGIINLTPDSFYENSRSENADTVIRLAEKMISEGATIIDIGGQSTRPGSKKVSPDEELKRIIGPLQALHKSLPDAIISIDTYYSRVAKEAVQAGAVIVNDVSGGDFDSEMIGTVADLKVPYVLMHIKGDPETMQENPEYDDIAKEVLEYFIMKLDILKKAGVDDVIIDPGFGFGKTIDHNFQLLQKLSILSMTGKPVLAGISRKSTIYKTLGVSANEALNGTSVLNTIALLNGASILRVHDVKEAKEAVVLVDRYMNASKK
ncbi:MAG TPA: dihydropteroate synthase [Chitinophagaceae bacterium]|nr:dihydropteroate synthase [Chitinophagaceae bacterium]